MEIFKWIIIFVILEIVTIFVFATIYNSLESLEVRDYFDGIYLAVQIQTSIGMSNTITERSLQFWITIQALISDILNILLITFIGIYIGQMFTREIIASEK